MNVSVSLGSSKAKHAVLKAVWKEEEVSISSLLHHDKKPQKGINPVSIAVYFNFRLVCGGVSQLSLAEGGGGRHTHTLDRWPVYHRDVKDVWWTNCTHFKYRNLRELNKNLVLTKYWNELNSTHDILYCVTNPKTKCTPWFNSLKKHFSGELKQLFVCMMLSVFCCLHTALLRSHHSISIRLRYLLL